MAEILSSSSSSDNRSRLEPGQKLYTGQSIYSTDGSVSFRMQDDGKVAVYHGGENCRWQNTAEQRYDASYCTMDHGKLKIIGKNGQELWSAGGNSSNEFAFLEVQNDGNVVIYSPDWATYSNK